MNIMDLRRGINLAVDTFVAHLKTRAKTISTMEEIAHVGRSLANGEREIWDVIARAMKAGKNGVITESIGGASEVHVSKKDRVADALNATKAAVEEGIVPGECMDMVKAGILDPVKVIRTALTNAASVSSLLLTTTEAFITELPNDDAPAFPPGGMVCMGGMGGMDYQGALSDILH